MSPSLRGRGDVPSPRSDCSPAEGASHLCYRICVWVGFTTLVRPIIRRNAGVNLRKAAPDHSQVLVYAVLDSVDVVPINVGKTLAML